jgi:Mitosis protein DIM1
MLININIQLIDIIETVYRGASKGRGLVVSPKGQLNMHDWNHIPKPLSIRLFDTLQILVLT